MENNEQNTNNTQGKKPTPWGLILGAVAVVMIFVFGLILINKDNGSNATNNSTNTSSNVTNPTPTTTKTTTNTTTETNNSVNVTVGSYSKKSNPAVTYELCAGSDKKVEGVSGCVINGNEMTFFSRAAEVDAYRSKFGIPASEKVRMRGDITIWSDREMKKETIDGVDYYIYRHDKGIYGFDIFGWCVYVGDDYAGIDKYLTDSYYRDHPDNPLRGWIPHPHGGGNQYYAFSK